MNVTEQLHRAIQAGLLPEVQNLVKEGAKLDHVLGMRGTALCAAIEARNLEITEFLIHAGCDVNAQDFDGEPPLLLALRKDSPGEILGRKPSLDIAKVLIDNKNCNVNKYDPLTKKSALHYVAEQGMVEVAEWLMSAPHECNVNAVDRNGNSALHLAVHEGHSKVVQVLVSNPKCLLKIYNRAGLTPLHICANTGDSQSLNILITRLLRFSKESLVYERETGMECESELSVNINAVNVFGKETCLHVACRNSHVNIVKVLLDNGAKVNCLNNIDNTALLLSLGSVNQWQTMSNEIPKLLLKKGANPNIKAPVRCRYIKNNSTVTPLIMAAMNNNVELAKLLVQHGADVNVADDNGQTPLYTALSENAQPVAQYLLRECPGVNVNVYTVDGSTCLHAVMKFCDPGNPKVQIDMVNGLLEAGAQLTPDNQGQNPIESAFANENHQILDALLEGTKTNAYKLTYGQSCLGEPPTMLYIAVTNGCYDLVKVLLAHGADINERRPDLDNLSLLYIALYNEEYKIAEFLVENGVDLQQETFIFQEFDSKENKENIRSAVNKNSDSDNSDSDVSESDYDSDDLFRGNDTFKKWLRELVSSPRSLKLLCLNSIRSHFRVTGVPFYKLQSLPLPQKLRDNLRYR